MEELKENIKWIDMDTLECHCYDCCLHDWENNKCKDINLCKRPKQTYKGFYITLENYNKNYKKFYESNIS